MKKAGSEAGSGGQWYGPEYPDPYQNVPDPEHCQREYGGEGTQSRPTILLFNVKNFLFPHP
jgi:hypothetical protein